MISMAELLYDLRGNIINCNGACQTCSARTWVKEVVGMEGRNVCNPSRIVSFPIHCPNKKNESVQNNERTTQLTTDLRHKWRLQDK